MQVNASRSYTDKYLKTLRLFSFISIFEGLAFLIFQPHSAKSHLAKKVWLKVFDKFYLTTVLQVSCITKPRHSPMLGSGAQSKGLSLFCLLGPSRLYLQGKPSTTWQLHIVRFALVFVFRPRNETPFISWGNQSKRIPYVHKICLTNGFRFRHHSNRATMKTVKVNFPQLQRRAAAPSQNKSKKSLHFVKWWQLFTLF